MKTVGIIAEFNPFHNGHAYLIEKARELTNADHVIVVMSGNFVQRGAPAFMDKFTRTAIALENNVDLVLELPVCYSMSSAAYFATGAVATLDKLNVVDYLCFGCENDDLDLLNLIADIIIDEDECYSEALQSYLKTGMSFSRSRENAIIKSLSLRGVNMSSEELSLIISSPNSILAIEYIIAMRKSESKMVPVPIKRLDKGYHSSDLDGHFASASAIRKLFGGKSIFTFNNVKETLSDIVPANCMELLENEYKKTYPIVSDDFSPLVGNELIKARYNNTEINNLFDITDDLANRITNLSGSYEAFDSFVNTCNSSIFTSSRISRILFYLLFNYTKDDYFTFKDEGYVYYFRVLGFNKAHNSLLTEIKTNSDIPLITKISNAFSVLSENGKRLLSINMMADEIYRLVSIDKYNFSIPKEPQYGVIIKDE